MLRSPECMLNAEGTRTTAKSKFRLDLPEHLSGHMLIYEQAYLLQAPVRFLVVTAFESLAR